MPPCPSPCHSRTSQGCADPVPHCSAGVQRRHISRGTPACSTVDPILRSSTNIHHRTVCYARGNIFPDGGEYREDAAGNPGDHTTDGCRNGDGEEKAYLSGVRGSTAADATCGLLERWRVLDLQQIQARTLSQFLQVVLSPREGAHHDSVATDACAPGIGGGATTSCDARPPSAPVGGATTRSTANSDPYPVAVPAGCSSPHKGGGHSSVTSSGVAAPSGSAHGFLARRRLQKAHKKMQDREAALAAVTFTFDAEGCDLNSLDGYQQLCQSAAVSKGAHGVFPTDGVFQFCGDSGRGGVFLLVSSGVPSASAFRLRPSRGHLRWSSSRLLPSGCAPLVQMVSMGSRWSYTCNFVMRMVPTVGESHDKNSESFYQIKNNQIS
jgi:hypothetical protein